MNVKNCMAKKTLRKVVGADITANLKICSSIQGSVCCVPPQELCEKFGEVSVDKEGNEVFQQEGANMYDLLS